MPRLVRDTVLFVVGVGLIVNEALRQTEPRFYLLVLYAAMVGLPAFLSADTASAIERFLRGRSNGNGARNGNGHAPEAPKEPKPPPLAFWRIA